MEHRLEKAHPKHQTGRFKRLKNATSTVLQLVLFVTPWLYWNGRPIVMLDLPGRKLHLLHWTFWPQETHFLLLLLLIAGLLLFFVTSLLGRLWCGYACPQTLLSHSFIFVERMIEGDRFKRIKLERGPWNEEKVRKLLFKWSIWLGMSIFLGITFAGYYTPIRALTGDLLSGDAQPGTLGIIGFFTAVSLFFFGFLRGRFCSTMCPYARFQGAMFDRDTVMVNYDVARGEPRGKAKDPSAGSCVDCKLCVQVCPQNIDIRKGVQFECINCAACVDACDSVMAKLERPLGLIRYASEAEIEGGKTRWKRPRPLLYAAAIVGAIGVFGYLAGTRMPLELDAVRARDDGGFSRTADGRISNRFEVRLINKQAPEMLVKLSLEGLDGAELVVPVNPISVPSEQSKVVSIFVLADSKTLKKAVSHFRIVATSNEDTEVVRKVETTYLRGGI